MLTYLRVEGWAASEEVTAVAVGVQGGVHVDTAGWLGELGIEREADADKVIGDMVREVLWGNTRVVKAKWLAERAVGRAQQDAEGAALPPPPPGGGGFLRFVVLKFVQLKKTLEGGGEKFLDFLF